MSEKSNRQNAWLTWDDSRCPLVVHIQNFHSTHSRIYRCTLVAYTHTRTTTTTLSSMTRHPHMGEPHRIYTSYPYKQTRHTCMASHTWLLTHIIPGTMKSSRISSPIPAAKVRTIMPSTSCCKDWMLSETITLFWKATWIVFNNAQRLGAIHRTFLLAIYLEVCASFFCENEIGISSSRTI